MALVPYTITALAESDAQGTDGKNIVAGATCSMYSQPSDSVVTLYDDASGSNGSTAKVTGATGQVVVYVEPGSYRVSVNAVDSYALVGAEKQTTLELINSASGSQTGDTITTTGFTAAGDGGGAQWLATATTGQTPSQTPAQLGNAELTDGSGRLWRLSYGNSINIRSVGNSVNACEGAISLTVDLDGQTIESPLASTSNNYFNGNLVLTGTVADLVEQKQMSEYTDYSISRPRTKSPITDWTGLNVLWLGTSIPIQGSEDSYPFRFGDILDCNITNNAWAGSHASYDFSGDAFDISTVKSLSMTEADRLWGLATYGASSAYDDSFDIVTLASRMTADYIIKNAFMIEGDKDVVMLDHNHNDRQRDVGILNPSKRTVSGVTLGVETVYTLSDASGLTVGNGCAVEIVGINNLNMSAGRISQINGNNVTVQYDSSGFTGSFVSGDFVELDRGTVYGGFNFLIYYIKNMSIIYGGGNVKIVLSTAPSEYTYNTYNQYIWRVGELIKDIADKWGLSVFDIGFLYDIKQHDHLTYFPDTVHPSTKGSRSSITNQWVSWAVGGMPKQANKNDFIPSGGESFIADRGAVYSEAKQGFTTPVSIYTTGAQLINDNFTNLTDWTLSGTSPAVVAAPWSGGGNAVLCQGTESVNSELDNYKSYGDDLRISFDLQMPVVSGLIEQGDPKGTIQIMNVRVPQNYISLQLLASSSDIKMRVSYFKEPNIDLVNLSDINFKFEANTKYNIEIELKKSRSESDPDGEVLVKIDGNYVYSLSDLDTFGQSTPTYLKLSSVMSGVDSFDCYFGNCVVNNLIENDYSSRYTGNIVTSGGTLNIVNGIITEVT